MAEEETLLIFASYPYSAQLIRYTYAIPLPRTKAATKPEGLTISQLDDLDDAFSDPNWQDGESWSEPSTSSRVYWLERETHIIQLTYCPPLTLAQSLDPPDDLDPSITTFKAYLYPSYDKQTGKSKQLWRYKDCRDARVYMSPTPINQEIARMLNLTLQEATDLWTYFAPKELDLA